MRSFGNRWLLILIPLLLGCATSDAPTDPSASVRSYSYPFTNGLQYKYARFSTTLLKPDTSIYQIRVSLNANIPSSMISTGKGTDSAGILLYNFIVGSDPNTGQPALTLSNNLGSIYALEGNLNDNDTWTADVTTNTTATVLAHSDDYRTDGAQPVDFSQVIEVKYHKAADPEDTYIVRYFSKNYGLIVEKYFAGATVAIGTLQLLEVGTLLSATTPSKFNPVL